MERKELERLVEEVVRKHLEDSLYVQVGVSNRHTHLKQEDVEMLFGKGYSLTKLKDLKQPGEFVAQETIVVEGPKESFPKVRILGPSRRLTQIELSLSDARVLGITVPIRESGHVEGSASVILRGPNGSVTAPVGAIAAHRHIHMPVAVAKAHGLENGSIVSVQTLGPRPLIFLEVMLRVSDRYALEMHVDVDEANAACLDNGDLVKIRKDKE